jgi:Cys-tRNA(Pro) deacylase
VATDGQPRTPAIDAVAASGIRHRVVRTERAASAEESAQFQGIETHQLLRTIVVRRGEGDYLFVLVPGDRTIAWPKLRAVLGVQRLSMPDADTAFAVTGYRRGTITPFGATTAWPVVADERLRGRRVTLGAGAPGVAVAVDADSAVAALRAQVADVTDPEPGPRG